MSGSESEHPAWINPSELLEPSQRSNVCVCINKKKNTGQAWSSHNLLSLLDEAVLPLEASIPSKEGTGGVVARGMSDIALSWKSAAGAPAQLLKTQHGRGWMNARSDISGLC